MKSNYKLLTFFLCILLCSCKKSDDKTDIKSVESLLTRDPWKMTRVERAEYLNGKLDTVYKSNDTTHVLTFNKDFTVILGGLTLQPINGQWVIDNNKEIVTTDLQLRVSSATGNPTPFFFYPSNKIIQLDDTVLILEVKTNALINQYTDSEGVTTQSSYIEKRFFIH